MKIKRLTDHNCIQFTPEELPILIVNDTTNAIASDSEYFPCYDLHGRIRPPQIAPKIFVLSMRPDQDWYIKPLYLFVNHIGNRIWYSDHPFKTSP